MSGKEFGQNWKFNIATRGSFLMEKMTILPVNHHGGHKVGPGPLEQKKIYFKFCNTQITAIMKTKQVCIWSAFWKHGWILLKPGVQVSIWHCIIENENRINGRSKIHQELKKWGFLGDSGIYMRSLGDRVI
jgi:hypothetical protein